MSTAISAPPHPRVTRIAVLLIATLIAVISARPYSGGWNDGSRLATVEELADEGTLRIDTSVFVQPIADPALSPHDPALPELRATGTLDKMLIDGHYYSDKPPVPALLMAAIYRGWYCLTGWTARDHPGAFCYWMTLLSSGVAYIVAVGSVYRLSDRLGLSLRSSLLLTSGFGLATVTLPYVRHVNSHVLLLAVVAVLTVALHDLAEASRNGRPTWRHVAWIGAVAGFGYTTDLGAGPVLLACLLPLIVWRRRSRAAVTVFVAAAMPWLILHHAISYKVGGTFGPANAVPEYFAWPGSPFGPANMTGVLNHSFGHFFVYAAALLVGKRGLLGHNLPLYLALLGGAWLLRRRVAEWPEVCFAGCWCAGVWLAYALTSNNYSGVCCSIRWFVPFLACGYYVLALLLQYRPELATDLAILTVWGMMAAALMWHAGPWMPHMMPFYWPIQAGALLSWGLYRIWRRLKATDEILEREASLPEVILVRWVNAEPFHRSRSVPALGSVPDPGGLPGHANHDSADGSPGELWQGRARGVAPVR